MVLFTTKAYLQFLAKSSNQHGVHSPFVFDLVTKCFYNQHPYIRDHQLKQISGKNHLDIRSKHARALVRIMNYLPIKKVLLIVPPINQIESLFNLVSGINISYHIYPDTKYDLFYLDVSSLHKEEHLYRDIRKGIHNNSVIIIPKIHQDKASENTWNSLKNEYGVTVSIDTFYFGFLFFRREQAKQHFFIRL